LTKTFDDPPITTPPQPVLPLKIAAGLPLMNTFGEPSTTGPPFEVSSPARAAGLPPTRTLELPPVTTPGAPGAGDPDDWAAATLGPQTRLAVTARKDVRIRIDDLVGSGNALCVSAMLVPAILSFARFNHFFRNVLTSETLPSW
jgi:hypothetical protein